MVCELKRLASSFPFIWFFPPFSIDVDADCVCDERLIDCKVYYNSKHLVLQSVIQNKNKKNEWKES